MKKIYILCATLLASVLTTSAQTNPNDTILNRTVVVEKEFNPIIQGASKVNVLPKVEEPTITAKNVEYAQEAIPANAVPVALVKPLLAKEFEANSLPGYLRLGYGNYGNLDARAHYTFKLSSKDLLGIDFSALGMNGKLDNPFSNDKWKSRYYKAGGVLDYKHQFERLDLRLFMGMGVHNFNYIDVNNTKNQGKLGDDDFNFYRPRQRFTKANFGLALKSTDETARILYDVTAQFMLYNRKDDILDSELKEYLMNTQAKLWTFLGSNKIGLDLNMHNRILNSELIKNYTTLDLNPYYGLELDNLKMRLGANIDLGFGYGESFLVSPDVDIQYIFSDSYVLYAKAGGGRINTDFRRFETLSPYTFIGQKNRDTYEQLNASIGFKASPIPGLWFNIYGGFQKLKDDLYQDIPQVNSPISYFANEDTKNVYIAAQASYNYKNIVELSLSAMNRKWKTDGYNNNALLYKPKTELEANIEVNPIKALSLAVNYRFVSRQEPKVWLGKQPVSDISNLSIKATYSVIKNLSVYAMVDNLLNKKYQYYYGYPVQGINFMAGFSFKF